MVTYDELKQDDLKPISQRKDTTYLIIDLLQKIEENTQK